jgi:hypothetical protein
MNRKRLKRHIASGLVLSASLWFYLPGTGIGFAQDRTQADSGESFIAWQSPAKLHRIVGREKGDLSIGADGVAFQTTAGKTERWDFLDIQTFRLSTHGLALETYQNRKRHVPGVARYKFDLDQAIPPSVAAELTMEVQRPSQNAVPYPSSVSTVIAAHHRTLIGGTNGVLRLGDDGIDYVTGSVADCRSWRWADLQTVSNPDPWHLFVIGYRDTYEFDLKEEISRKLFNHISDEIWAHNESELRSDPLAPTLSTPRNYGRWGDE